MKHPNASTVGDRVAVLERHCRMMRCVVAATALCALFAVFLLDGAGCGAGLQAGVQSTSPALGVVRAEAFELLDAQGRVQARLVMHEDMPCLSFLDPNGTEWLTVGPRNGLQFSDAEAHRQVTLGHRGLFFWQPDGGAGSSFTRRSVRLHGQVESCVTLSPGNGIRLWDTDGVEKASLQARNGLRLYDGDDRQIGLQPWHGLYMNGAARSGAPTLSIKIIDADGRTRAHLGTDLVLRDALGQALSDPKVN